MNMVPPLIDLSMPMVMDIWVYPQRFFKSWAFALGKKTMSIVGGHTNKYTNPNYFVDTMNLISNHWFIDKQNEVLQMNSAVFFMNISCHIWLPKMTHVVPMKLPMLRPCPLRQVIVCTPLHASARALWLIKVHILPHMLHLFFKYEIAHLNVCL
jgi:hypothetical protein